MSAVPAPTRKGGLGSAMVGGNPQLGRVENGFYATPDEATVALLRRVQVKGRVWECCCGEGHISRVLEANGNEVVSSDLIDRGYGETGPGHDLKLFQRLRAPTVITNPPFDLAEELIWTIMELQPDMFALLLKTTYWSADERVELYRKFTPALHLQLTWRVDFRGLGRPTMECSWFVWLRGHQGPMQHDLLQRPFPRSRRKKSTGKYGSALAA